MPESVCSSKKVRTFATAKPKGIASLGYGVMVTLQILVLSFLVRIQVAQLMKRKGSCSKKQFPFFFSCHKFGGKGNIPYLCACKSSEYSSKQN